MNNVTIISSISKHDLNGTGRYSYELIRNLLSQKSKSGMLKVIQPQKRLRFPISVLYEVLVLPVKLLGSKSNIYHATSPESAIAPLLLNRKTIVTVYDVIYLSYPKGTKLLKRIYFKICTKLLKRARKIITISDFSKYEISQKINIEPHKIVTIHLGIDKRFRVINKAKKENFKVGYLGGNAKRKNVATLIKAFTKIKEKNNFKKYKLYLAIKKDSKTSQLLKKIKARDVIFLGRINEQEIVKFYNSLDLFVYPSLYEGFGFPPLEAMACGCPVIASDSTSIPEITGNAALLTDTNDSDKLADAMMKVLSDKSLRKKLINKGINKSNEYTWEKTIKETNNVYKHVIE